MFVWLYLASDLHTLQVLLVCNNGVDAPSFGLGLAKHKYELVTITSHILLLSTSLTFLILYSWLLGPLWFDCKDNVMDQLLKVKVCALIPTYAINWRKCSILAHLTSDTKSRFTCFKNYILRDWVNSWIRKGTKSYILEEE